MPNRRRSPFRSSARTSIHTEGESHCSSSVMNKSQLINRRDPFVRVCFAAVNGVEGEKGVVCLIFSLIAIKSKTKKGEERDN